MLYDVCDSYYLVVVYCVMLCLVFSLLLLLSRIPFWSTTPRIGK